jgi:hypothetical protein
MTIDPYVLFAVLVATFFGGVMFGVSERKRTRNFEPIEHGNFDEEKWINRPPPWKLGGSAGERPPNVVTFIRGPFVK